MTKINAILSEFSSMCNGIDVNYTFNASNAILVLNSFSTIYVQEGVLPYNFPTSQTDGSIVYITKHGTTSPAGNITLNTKTLDNASDLGVAAVLVHEMMHSYFLWGAFHSTGNESRAFQDINYFLFDKNSNPLPQNTQLATNQHLALATFYIDSMAGLLKTFANGKGIVNSPDPNITLEQYCKDLLWNLLEEGTKLAAPNSSRAKTNAEKELKNTSSSTHVKGC